MASKAESEVESSPSVLMKLLNIGRGPHAYKEVTAGTPPKSGQAFPTFPQAPANHTLLQVIWDEDIEDERREWVEWLENDSVPADAKKDKLYHRYKGWTSIHHAARYSRTQILGCAADVDGVDMNIVTDADGLTPLLVAAKHNVRNSIVWMIQNKETCDIDIEATTCAGQNALHLVVQNLRCEYSLEPLLRQLDRKLWRSPDQDGNTPLHVACFHGNLDALQNGLFKLEIWRGEEEGPVTSDGEEGEGSEEGSDAEEPNEAGDREPEGENEGGLPLTSLKIVDMFKGMIRRTNKAKRTALHLAAENGHDSVVAVLIKNCREVIRWRDSEGNMALHLACYRGHMEVVREIMAWEPTTIGNKHTNNKGETPVHCAAYNSTDSGALMAYLLSICKDNSVLDTHEILSQRENVAHHTPLMLACTKGKPEVVKVLLLHGADVKLTEGKEEQAGQEEKEQETLNSLELAIENSRREVAKVIIDRPDWKKSLRNINIIDRVADTPFRRMIRKMPDIALLVLEKCTEEKNDRDDANFEMLFDYEFVEDFYVGDRDKSPRQLSSQRRTGTTNALVSGSGGGSVESLPGTGKGEEGKKAEVELKEVRVVAGDEDQEAKVVGKRSAAEDTSHSPTSDATSDATSDEPPNEDWKPKEYDKQNHVLNVMVENHRSELLQHPLVTSLLNHKWNRFGAWLYFANLFFYLVYVVSLTAFALAVPNPQDEMCMDSGNDTRADKCDISTNRSNFLYFAAAITVVLAVARLILEVLQLVHWRQSKHRNLCGYKLKLYVNWGYWLDWTNYLEVVLYVFSLVFVIVFRDECLCPSNAQWQIGTVAVFFAWIGLLLFLYKLPKIGIYVGMMLQITRRFLNVVIMAILLSLAFGFAFYMSFYQPSIPASPFRTPILSFVKLMVMTGGGPDDSIFRFENEGSGEREALPFPEVAFFIWVIFIVIMAILFVNFLVGLAVDDVKQIQQSATLRRLSLKVDLVLSMEQVFPILRYHKRFATKSHKVRPNERLSWYWRLWRKFYSIVWDDDLTDSIQATLNPEEDTDYKVESLRGVVEQLVERHRTQEEMVAQILQYIQKQNKREAT